MRLDQPAVGVVSNPASYVVIPPTFRLWKQVLLKLKQGFYAYE